MARTLVYYFAFPHYRLEILNELRALSTSDFEFVAGQTSRAGIATLSASDVDGLTIVPSTRVGPVSWDRGVFGRASGRWYDSVVLGPATLSLTTWAILIVRKLCRRRTFLWGNCGGFGDRSVKRRVLEIMNRLATGVLVYGDNEAIAAGQYGLDHRRIHVVNNATHSNVDVLNRGDGPSQLQRALAAARHAKQDGILRILFVGRLNENKRLEVLLRAGSLLRRSYPQLVIDIIGDGDMRETLREKFPQEWVRFHGWVYDTEELNKYFMEATFVCSPFHMGLLAIDALRAGTPVLVPDNPMNGSEVEALTPLNSVRFPAGDAQGIVEAVHVWFATVEVLDVAEYSAARTMALSKWDPQGVAVAIARAVAE